MDLNRFRNVHFGTDDVTEEGLVDDVTLSDAAPVQRMRTRQVTLSPAEEYLRREGEVETIPDAMAALILSRKTFVQATHKGVDIKSVEVGGRRRYWHPDSIVCNRIGSGESLRVLALWSPLDLSKIHLMTERGEYIETLPAEVQPDALDSESLASELAKHRRAHHRLADHLRTLHAEDSQTELDNARANTAAVQRVVSILPVELPDQGEAEPSRAAAAVERGGVSAANRIARVKSAKRRADEFFDQGGRGDFDPAPAPSRSVRPAVVTTLHDPFADA